MLDRIRVKKNKEDETNNDNLGPRNPEQEKVNKGRRRKTYQTREENEKRDRTI